MTQPRPAGVSTRRPFTCPACGQVQTFAPAEWPWVLEARPDARGAFERLFYSRVRCPR